MKRLLSGAIFLLLAVLANETVIALPRFASRTGTKCQSCHINPSGGGMRQAFGQQYGRETLPVPTWSSGLELEEFTTKLSEFVSVGADMRTLFFVQQTPGGDRNDIFLMQADLYLNLKVAQKFSLYFSRGLRERYDAFGLLNVLPANGHFKFGKFDPNYGMKTDDHRAYIREKSGFSQQFPIEYIGGEIAVSPGAVTITAGMYNSPSRVSGPTMLGRVEGVFKASEDVNIWLGGNVFTKKALPNMRNTLLGGFGAVSYKDFTVVGEVDLIRNTGLGTTKDSTGIATHVEVDFVVTPGLDVKAAWDFFDPDKDLKTGSVSRYSVGFEFFPIQGFEVRPVYRFVVDDPTNIKNNEFQFLVHFFL
jgi:hypothetical protein